jgi:hypothetical protein
MQNAKSVKVTTKHDPSTSVKCAETCFLFLLFDYYNPIEHDQRTFKINLLQRAKTTKKNSRNNPKSKADFFAKEIANR